MAQLEAGVDGLALEGEDTEDALVDSVERIAGDEALKGFDAEGVLAQRERPLVTETSVAQSGKVDGSSPPEARRRSGYSDYRDARSVREVSAERRSQGITGQPEIVICQLFAGFPLAGCA